VRIAAGLTRRENTKLEAWEKEGKEEEVEEKEEEEVEEEVEEVEENPR
jgi:hypothetical protein